MLVRRHYRAAYAVALGILRTPMDAEDVCQDVFLIVLRRIEQCRDPERFLAWVLTIVRNRARNYWSYRRVRTVEELDVEIASSQDGPVQDLARRELATLLYAALDSLPAILRQVVLLHDLEGMRHREIADTLGISEGMSRQHLHYARRILRNRLDVQAMREDRYG